MSSEQFKTWILYESTRGPIQHLIDEVPVEGTMCVMKCGTALHPQGIRTPDGAINIPKCKLCELKAHLEKAGCR